VGCYITKEMALNALCNMQSFYSELVDVYGKYGVSIEEDLGRRNMLMSSLQEKMFATQIGKVYPKTRSDGKTGEPDIIIPEINSELECKLTSKNKSGSWALQTDYNTLSAKGSLDYLYVLASRDFSEFAVLFFEGLTCDDFRPPASGSRGKSRMRLSEALKKCTVVVGEVSDKSEKYISDATTVLRDALSSYSQRQNAQKRLDYWENKSSVSFGLEAA
jgi:hypothetical protein